MADITTGRGGRNRLGPANGRWDLMRFLRRRDRPIRDVVRWDPYFAVSWPFDREVDFCPDFEVRETREVVVFSADLPGVREQDIEVSVTGSRLSIRGRRDAERGEEGETRHTAERPYGAFSRAFTLPREVDTGRVRAVLDRGVLTVTVPKR